MSLTNTDATEQIPARMLNEFAYCPRLYYLEYIQREWAHSTDTLDGRFVHRRVDQEAGPVPAPENLAEQVKLHSRSILIGSDTLGAVARIDLIESAALRRIFPKVRGNRNASRFVCRGCCCAKMVMNAKRVRFTLPNRNSAYRLRSPMN
jgi:hypothetical protein